ncbi:MAG: hypothetical protein ACOY3I_09700 [Verrucomicrobiota bacterium]
MDQQNYNSFLPVLILLLAMTVVGSFQIYNGVDQKRQLDQAVKQLQPALNEAKAIDARLTGICRDLLDMTSRNPSAQKIVQEFNIRANEPATTIRKK